MSHDTEAFRQIHELLSQGQRAAEEANFGGSLA